MTSAWRQIRIVSFCVLLALSAFAQSKLVEDVEIRGYRRVSLEEIRKRILTAPGMQFQADQAVKDFEQVMKMEVFNSLQSSLVIKNGVRGGKIVVFDLKEKP